MARRCFHSSKRVVSSLALALALAALACSKSSPLESTPQEAAAPSAAPVDPFPAAAAGVLACTWTELPTSARDCNAYAAWDALLLSADFRSGASLESELHLLEDADARAQLLAISALGATVDGWRSDRGRARRVVAVAARFADRDPRLAEPLADLAACVDVKATGLLEELLRVARTSTSTRLRGAMVHGLAICHADAAGVSSLVSEALAEGPGEVRRGGAQALLSPARPPLPRDCELCAGYVTESEPTVRGICARAILQSASCDAFVPSLLDQLSRRPPDEAAGIEVARGIARYCDRSTTGTTRRKAADVASRLLDARPRAGDDGHARATSLHALATCDRTRARAAARAINPTPGGSLDPRRVELETMASSILADGPL